MNLPETDVADRPFTLRDTKLLALLLRPKGAQQHELCALTTKHVPARSFVVDSARLAKRLGGKAWADPAELGDNRRFGIIL
jgi:hypothetical protein